MQAARPVRRSPALFARRHPALFSLCAYSLAAAVCVGGALRPGRTLVPADILAGVPPFGEVVQGPAQNPILSDSMFQFLPWFHFLSEQLRGGHLPHWNPYILGGVPVTPNGFVSLYYPPFWLTRVLSPYDAYDVFVWLHLLIASLGVRWLARRLGASPFSSFAVGLGALAAGMWFHWSLHAVHFVAMVWIPVALAAAHQVIERPSPRSVGVLGSVFGLWWLGGNPQFAYYGTLALGVFSLALLAARWYREHRPPIAPAACLAAGVALGCCLAAPVLLPTATIGPEAILRTHEPEASITQSHLAPGNLMRALVPDAKGNSADGVAFETPAGYPLDTPFVGVVALVLLGAALGEARAHRWVLALLAGAVVLMALSFAGWPNAVLYRVLPLYDRFRASSRWLCVLPALVLPAAAIGLDGLRARRRGALRGALASGCLGAIAVLIWAAHVLRVPGAPHRYFALRAAVALGLLVLAGGGALLARRQPALIGPMLLIGIAFEVAFVTPRWYPSVRKADAYPQVEAMTVAQARGGRILRVGSTRTPIPVLSPVIPMVYGVSDAQGQAVLFPRAADRFLRTIDDYGSFAEAVNITPAVTNPAAVGAPAVAAFDVRTVFTDPGIDLPGATRLGGNNPVIWGVPSAGAAVVVQNARPATTEAMWDAVGRQDWDPAATASVEGLRDPVSGGGTVRGLAVTSDSESWSVSAPDGGFLRISASFDRGWRATIDGRRTRTYRTDGLFRGVVVPPGTHTVHFRYENRNEQRGMVLGIVAAVVLAALGALSRSRWGVRGASGLEGDGREPNGDPTVPPEGPRQAKAQSLGGCVPDERVLPAE